MRTLLYVFLLSTSIFAQQEEQLTSKARAVLEAEEQFLVPLNQTLSAVAEENGYAIDESYTYVDAIEGYDNFLKTGFEEGNLLNKIFTGSMLILTPSALVANAFLKKRFAPIFLASLLVSLPALPPIMFDRNYPYNRVLDLASDCVSMNPYRNCSTKKLSNSFDYVAELHYKLVSSGFTGGCFIWFKPNNLPTSPHEGYALTPVNHYTPFIEATKLDYEITNCTHKGVFPGQNDVVATGSIDLKRESL